MNPFFALQTRAADLLRAAPYFAGASIITEQVGDIASKIETDLLPVGFGVVVTTGKGDAVTSSLGIHRSKEVLTISLIHNPTTDSAHAVLDALHAAIEAVCSQPVSAATPLAAVREENSFRFVAHERRMDAPEELHVHHLTVSAIVLL
jgi:hypothetical protein